MKSVPCEFSFRDDGGSYTYFIENQTIQDGPITLNRVPGLSNNSVKALSIRDCRMPAFPHNLQDLFPKLEGLLIEDCTLESIGHEHIGKWKNLREIAIEKCKLKYLKGDTFRGLTELREISFEYNQLEVIDPDVLDGLEKLNYVSLLENPGINMFAHKGDLDKIKEEIKLKCKPKPTVRELEQQIQKQMTEIAELKSFKQKVLTDDAFKDFTINISDSSFKVHKLIFAAHSQTLAELFRNNPEAQELNLLNIPESTFKAVYDFIYTGQLPADVDYLELFAAAHRLKIDDLKKAAAAHLIENIDGNNSFEILVASNKFEHEELKMKAFETICIKMFPDRELDEELAKQPEKLMELIEAKKKLIDDKKKLDQMLEKVAKKN